VDSGRAANLASEIEAPHIADIKTRAALLIMFGAVHRPGPGRARIADQGGLLPGSGN